MPPADATTALTLNEPSFHDLNTVDESLGWEFQTNSAIDVNALGYYAYAPLQYSHEVGIFNSSGTLLVSSTVPSGGSSDSYNYVSVSPTVLASGQDYYIMGLSGPYPNPDGYPLEANSSGFFTAPAISYIAGVYNNTSLDSLAFPNNTISKDRFAGTAFGPNFQFTANAAAAPEPSQLAMLAAFGLGLGGLFLRARRKASA